jgi:hypothetical protein
MKFVVLAAIVPLPQYTIAEAEFKKNEFPRVAEKR